MARVKVFGLDRVSKRLRMIQKSLGDKDLLERVGRTSIRHIQERTRRGYAIEDGKPELFKPLKPSTIERRKKLAKANRTSRFFAPAISNLHFTGQLLRSLAFKIVGRKVFVEPSGSRRPLKTLTGKRSTAKVPTNKQVAQHVADQGRPFLGVDESGKKAIRDVVVRHLRRIIRRR